MAIKIREGVFETNSSSMHSLSYVPGASDEAIGNMNEITVGAGEHSWGPYTLTTWLEKADYLGIECRYDNDWKTGLPPEKELYAGQISRRELLETALRRKFPNIEVVYDGSGYIDHQSYGEVWGDIFNAAEPEEMIYEVIFGQSVINIDHDNH